MLYLIYTLTNVLISWNVIRLVVGIVVHRRPCYAQTSHFRLSILLYEWFPRVDPCICCKNYCWSVFLEGFLILHKLKCCCKLTLLSWYRYRFQSPNFQVLCSSGNIKWRNLKNEIKFRNIMCNHKVPCSHVPRCMLPTSHAYIKISNHYHNRPQIYLHFGE